MKYQSLKTFCIREFYHTSKKYNLKTERESQKKFISIFFKLKRFKRFFLLLAISMTITLLILLLVMVPVTLQSNYIPKRLLNSQIKDILIRFV